MTLLKIVKVLTDELTVHGFRSTFRDWCGEKTAFSREHAELCLAHSIGNAVERAYRRGNALEQRRRILIAWEHFILTGQPPADGTALQASATDTINYRNYKETA